MRVVGKAALGAVVLVGLAASVSAVHALTNVTVDKCLASQLRIVGKGAAAYARCYVKAAAMGTFPDPDCLAKAAAKITPALARLESKKTCPVEGSGETRRTDAYSYAAGLYTTIGHAPEKCDAAKTKLAGAYVRALANCHAKAATKSGVVSNDCVFKAAGRLADGVAKAETGIDCTHSGQTTVLADEADAFVDDEVCALDPSNPDCIMPTPTPTLTPAPTITATPVCNNGANEPGEPCDASAPSAGWGACSPDLTCTDCTCACPTTMVLSPDAAAPESVLDAGWTGIWHRMPVVGGGDLTVQLACPGTSHPCGTCTVTGPIANPQAGAGQLDSRRCSTDSSKHCTSDATCATRTCLGGTNHGAPCTADSECPSASCPAAGTCTFYAAPPFPLAAGGVSVCMLNRIDDPITGMADVASGEVAIGVPLTTEVRLAAAIDGPCPRCSDAGAANDGVAGGTCDDGPRVGLACDANGAVSDRPDFGRTSLDCPSAGTLVGTVLIDLQNATDPVTKTLTTASPNCTGSAGDKCLCDTCNSGNHETCDDNADCPDPAGPIGAICGGRRCVGGGNDGTPCSNNSECPGVAQGCSRVGAPTRPSACLAEEDVVTRVMACADGDADGEGDCIVGPTDQNCTVASGHAQRGCAEDAHCGGGVGTCVSAPRHCFLTGGGTFQAAGQNDGTNTLMAVGMSDAPLAGVSHSTLGAVFCVGPTSSNPVNYVAGLPGPARVTVKSTMTTQP